MNRANFTIPDTPEFSTEMEMLKTTDPAHADLFNKVFAQLLENDAYIAGQTNALLNKKMTAVAALSASKWSSAYPYTQTVAVSGVTEDMDIKVIGVYVPDGSTADQVKARNKAAGFLMSKDNATGAGTVTFYAYKKATVDFAVIVEGG